MSVVKLYPQDPAFQSIHGKSFSVAKVDQQRALKESIKKNMALENRIRRLAYEQQRAQKLTDIATEKASKLLDARDRHVQEVEKRMKMQDQRRQDLEGLRIRNFTSRAQSLQAKVMAQKSVVEVK